MPPLHEKVTGVASTNARGSARAPLADLEAMLDSLRSIVTLWGTDLRNIYANRATVEWWGKTPAEIAGTHVRDLIGPELFDSNLPFMRRALAGEPQNFDRVLTDHRGRPRHSQISYTPLLMDGAVGGFFVVLTDISVRVAAQDALRENAAHITTLQERQRVAGGLHDGVIEGLFRVERGLNAALLADPQSRDAAVTSAIAAIDEAIRELRGAIGDLTLGSRPVTIR